MTDPACEARRCPRCRRPYDRARPWMVYCRPCNARRSRENRLRRRRFTPTPVADTPRQLPPAPYLPPLRLVEGVPMLKDRLAMRNRERRQGS